jgi:hypothetical protein
MTVEERRLLTLTMMAGDSKGNLWTIGTETGKWYRQSGEQWIEGQPPEKLLLTVPERQFKEGEMLLRELKEELENLALKAQRCVKCGGELGKNARFCPGCGAAVPQVAQPKPPAPTLTRCPKCKQELQPNQNFCPGCGTKLR